MDMHVLGDATGYVTYVANQRGSIPIFFDSTNGIGSANETGKTRNQHIRCQEDVCARLVCITLKSLRGANLKLSGGAGKMDSRAPAERCRISKYQKLVAAYIRRLNSNNVPVVGSPDVPESFPLYRST